MAARPTAPYSAHGRSAEPLGSTVRPPQAKRVLDNLRTVDPACVSSRTVRRLLLPALVSVSALAALAAPAAASAAPRCANADLQPSSDNLPLIRDATLCLLNAERTSRGMRKLKASPQLGRSAQRFSAMMVQESFFDHVSPGGSTLLSRVRRGTDYLTGALNYALGENIAWGSGHYATPAETVVGWMNSAGHRRNILNRRFRHVGIGIAIGAPMDAGGMAAATYTTDFGYRTRGR